ncbi:uncharacterized protein SCHCODRAFT_02715241 [Schizophyllum commune H4-8]|uniref:uncharacterized protein n=1 Tax=Schizophyllum commune (strain H4-8 / FGSC 9210) TaxID=578458 RepID=UPI00215E33C2|nr:uncharacterized protein SCHCODRAFT_02715241 [Schizophyllum commune H4-8]KAI5887091.1 hypothetical protein SCHCODRAFT_02715241 [Schizophyllum commune H4-8]
MSYYRFVLVEPDTTVSWQSPIAEEGERGLSFCMVVSDCNKIYSLKRPTKEQVQRLTRLFGYEPRWTRGSRRSGRITGIAIDMIL